MSKFSALSLKSSRAQVCYSIGYEHAVSDKPFLNMEDKREQEMFALGWKHGKEDVA